ncbi:hypothetical protein BC940DRAFT_300615 [Gongronella butleri]|nr:hypothetical protein BC940DRAFT_300615 [Gongronella butleri]
MVNRTAEFVTAWASYPRDTQQAKKKSECQFHLKRSGSPGMQRSSFYPFSFSIISLFFFCIPLDIHCLWGPLCVCLDRQLITLVLLFPHFLILHTFSTTSTMQFDDKAVHLIDHPLHPTYRAPSSFEWLRRWWMSKTQVPAVWCFRLLRQDLICCPFCPFSRANQKLLWDAVRKGQMEIELSEPRIGSQPVRIVFQESLAYTFDADFSPVLYDIVAHPPMIVSPWKRRKNSPHASPHPTV